MKVLARVKNSCYSKNAATHTLVSTRIPRMAERFLLVGLFYDGQGFRQAHFFVSGSSKGPGNCHTGLRINYTGQFVFR